MYILHKVTFTEICGCTGRTFVYKTSD